MWREKGLTGDQPRGTTMVDMIQPVNMLLDAYRGDQWRHIGMLNGISWDAHLVINTMFTTANTMEAQLLARLPKAKVFGKTRDSSAKARNWENLLNWGISEMKLERAWNAALRDAFFKFGVVRLGYTPPGEQFDKKDRQVEFGSPTYADLPWLRRIAPWDIRIDPLAESWHADGDARWCEFISLYTIEQLKLL